MELMSPAGNIEKLRYAYMYGADAAYIGLKNFSLRARASNFDDEEYKLIESMKGDKKLYGTVNMYFHNADIGLLRDQLDFIALYPFDAFIISDVGALPILQKRFPEKKFFLSTQANCTNASAAKMYYSMGFSRVIPGRELSLHEIREIKDAVPDVEIEIFVHGAMCLAYAGRCFLSKWMIDRSANKGDCAHSCRWDYLVLEEKERPGEYYPIIEEEKHTTILSSKDICMIDYLKEIQDSGVDSLKIEGRMKSIYYTAVITRAYRKALEALEGKAIPDLDQYKEEIGKVSHREFSTGFYFGKDEVEQPADHAIKAKHSFLGSIGRKITKNRWELNVRNQIKKGQIIEFIGPDVLFLRDSSFNLLDPEGNELEQIDHGKECFIQTTLPLEEGYIVRKNLD